MCHLFYNVDGLFLVLHSCLYQTKLKIIVLAHHGVLSATESVCIVYIYMYIYIYRRETGKVSLEFRVFSSWTPDSPSGLQWFHTQLSVRSLWFCFMNLNTQSRYLVTMKFLLYMEKECRPSKSNGLALISVYCGNGGKDLMAKS